MATFSVIMPSFLGKYKNAALNREKKIVRAIQSVVNQTHKDFELIVIADGCQKTVDIVNGHFGDNAQVVVKKVKKQKLWSGQPRNEGIDIATKDWICYLDIDDLFLENHLEVIDAEISKHPGMDWLWFNDFSYNINKQRFDEHFVNIDEQGQCGTSNICHRRSMEALWPRGATYLHDWKFIGTLKAISKNYIKVLTPGYGICHVPHLLDI